MACGSWDVWQIFSFFHDTSPDQEKDGLARALNARSESVDLGRNLIGGRLGLGHDRALLGRLAALEGADGGIDRLLDQLRLWQGGLRAEPGHFTGRSLGARFYPVLYLLKRMGEARDWGRAYR
jgi:hypothetical protein